jgi:hypothetical protein
MNLTEETLLDIDIPTQSETKELIRLARLGLWAENYAGLIGYGLSKITRDIRIDGDLQILAEEAIKSFPKGVKD